MSDLRLWRHEARRAGRHLLLAPPLVAAALLAAGVGLSGAGFYGDWSVGAGPPLVVGLAAAAIVAGERAAELHLSLPTPLRTTMCRRLALLGASTLLGAVTLAAGLLGERTVTHSLSRFTLLCGFTALLAATGALAAVTLRSVAGASTVVLAVWLADLFVLDRMLTGPAARGAAQLMLAALLAARALRLLGEGPCLTEHA